MKLLLIEMSRLTTLFNVTRSDGQLYLPEAVLKLSNRYKFSSAPGSYDDLTSDRIEFKHGEFEGSAIESLEIYNDGVVVSSRSDTDFIDQFFDDLCEWIVDELGLSIIKTQSIERVYESTLIIEAEKNILKPLEAISKVSQLVERGLKESSGLELKYEPFGWTLATDQTQNPSIKPLPFRIERRTSTEFSMQHFLTCAPLKTKQHLDILRKLESLL